MNKPIVGINADFRAASHNQPAFSYVAAGYYDSIAKAGGIPLILAPLEDDASLHQVLDHLDACVMIGGGDLDPRYDNFMLHPATKPMEARRETFDRRLAQEVVERRIPVLAIGSGMQLLNVTCGGNLFLHIPEDLPGSLPHRDPQDPFHRHSLVVEPKSLIGRVYGEGEIRVTSRHHMAVDEVAQGFRVTARCQDGVIEAIESETIDWFAIGTQFHPECGAASALDIRIFEEFLEALQAPAMMGASLAKAAA
ncbi:gamma-glutamyl-gamma-aminobutyrate hydrolase family protein [Aureliella helgolandensis]|uniref:Glutamine amidotransferase n=1 Tax=Aureliella helgolandensis TaxID=2527968 RepID=A0A518G5W0_9BACT|nr:gamma-glutamyl-gamma-aminobutyrate hydrolase family protein [Aureliella helgolandensis]QDV23986.1 Putative glutamine amidotransferase [Aureliella helgolandensis]